MHAKETSLIWAASNGRKDIVAALLAVGADTKLKDKQDRDALNHARWNNFQDIAKMLEVNAPAKKDVKPAEDLF